MCEHNLVIGEEYRLVFGRYTCFTCREIYPMAFETKYVGDYEPGLHCFIPTEKYFCSRCGTNIVAISYDCRGASGPIDVTQEFLSLPVRSKAR